MASKTGSEREFVRCLECRHATFMQWYENPIVAQCEQLNERMVAQSKRVCKLFSPSGNKDPHVTHYDNYDEARANVRKAFFGE